MIKKKKKWIIIGIVALVVVGGIIGIGAGGGGKAAMPVTVVDAEKGEIKQIVEISGLVASEESVTYFAQINGVVSELQVENGQNVKAGSKLLTYDIEAMEDNLKKAELESKISNLGADATITSINASQSKASEAAKNYDDAVKYVAHFTECVGQLNGEIAKATELAEKQAKLAAEIAELEKKLEKKPDSEKTAKQLKEKTKEYKDVTKAYEAYDIAALKSALETCSNDLAEYKALEAEYKATKETSDPSANLQKAQQSAMKESSQMTVEEAKEALAEAQAGVVTPVNGIVSDVQVVEGQSVTEGTPLFTIADSSKLKVTIELTKYSMENVTEGQKAELTINGGTYTGTVTKVNKVAKVSQTGATVVEADIHIDNPDDKIYLGVEANAVINIAEKKDILRIPVECVNYGTDNVFCYVVKDGAVAKKEIETGISSGEFIEVLSGLEEKEQVINSLGTEYEEGTLVAPVYE